MAFDQRFLDDIKARLPVSQVVGDKVKLAKAGKEWKGLSPFNAERTPSFFVNDAKEPLKIAAEQTADKAAAQLAKDLLK